MNKRGDARSITRRPPRIATRRAGIGRLEKRLFYKMFRARRGTRAAERRQDGGSLRLRGAAENLWPKRRNIREAAFVYTGADRYAAALGEIQKKTPRWQPRGYDTQSFRPLIQEEVVSSG